MRFLHTSDWHLGRTLHGVDLHDAQRSVLGQLCRLVSDPVDGVPIDAVLISGDVYDRAVPPVQSVTLLADTLAALARHTTVIIIGGNHDSAIRLGFGSELFTERLQVRTGVASIGSPVMLDGVAVYPLPYLDPDHARHALSPDEPLDRSHQAVVSAAMDRVRADLGRRGPGVRSVVMGHVFVANGAASDSERLISVGGVDSVAAAAFDGVDYVALGHLHRPQQPAHAGRGLLRYSGSPLRYSFSEREHVKSVSLVDVTDDGVQVSEVALAQPRPMADLIGELDELLTSPALDPHLDSWVRLTVTDRARPDRMFERLRSRFPHALQMSHAPHGARPAVATSSSPAAELDPRQLGADFVSYVTRTAVTDAELDLFASAYEQAAAQAGELAS